MISKEIRRWLRKVDALTQVQALYLAHCQMTGSFVFGGYDPKTSDRDVLIPPHIKEGFFGYDTFAYESGRYSQEGYRSFYVKDENGIVFNLLFFETAIVFEKWKWATDQMMLQLNDGADFHDKKYRVSVFEGWKEEWERTWRIFHECDMRARLYKEDKDAQESK